MIKKLYAIRDLRSNYFLDIQMYREDSEALRVFGHVVCNVSDSFIYAYPEDYDLVHIGMYDDEDGVVEPIQHIKIANGNDLVHLRKRYGKKEDDINVKETVLVNSEESLQ